jgi:sigma-B regulation protein RsbU (phosphoserine phosphatase)
MKQLSDCRVLLVDDAKANLDILVEGLKADHKLSLALNGTMALQVAARTPPDLVLLDIMMPGLDGYEVCRRLRQMPETADVPIMFLSSLEEVQSKTRGFEVGANDYLTKPFDLLEVKARVRSLLKAKAYSDAVKEQIASELRVAREIQMGILPHDLAPLERAYGVSFGALLEPAREVGGDLYGICAARPDRLVMFLGDVSGKGIPASMFMVRAISLARLLAREIAEPERILARLNDELAVDNPSGMFVTFLCVVFEPTTGRLVLANAGHCRPVLLPVAGPPRWAVKNLGTALGFEPGLEFERSDRSIRSAGRVLRQRPLAHRCRRAQRPVRPRPGCRSVAKSSRIRRRRTAVGRHRDSRHQSSTGGHKGRIWRVRMMFGLPATPEEVMRAVVRPD